MLLVTPRPTEAVGTLLLLILTSLHRQTLWNTSPHAVFLKYDQLYLFRASKCISGTLLLLVLGSLHTQTIWPTRATSPIKLLIFLFFLGLYKSCNCFSSDAKAGCSIQVTIVFSSVHLFSIFNIKAPLISQE